MAITTLYQFQADLKALEQLQKELKKAQAELKKLTKDTEEYKKKTAEIRTLGKQFTTLKDNMGEAANGANNLNKAGNRLVNTFKSAAVAIASAFAVRAIVGGLKNIVAAFTEFEAQLAAVKAISGATAEEFESLEKTARDFGATTIFTATQVGKLQEEFARLGFSVEEINAATGATLNLAAATGESLAKSAQVAGSTLRAFGKDAIQTQNVVDVMAASFTSSALNLDKFTESMKFVAPVARTTGFTLEETTALMAKLADNGISGSIAGNALKNVFLRLGDESSKLSRKLGGPVQGLPQLIEAMKGLKEEGFGASDAIELLDKRSAPAFLALMQNINGLQDSVDILNNAEDAASKMAAIRLDTLEGDMTILKSAAEGLSIALGDEFDVSIRNIIFSLTNFIQEITKSESALGLIKNTLKAVAVAIQTMTVRFTAIGVVKIARGISSMAASFNILRQSILGVTAAQAKLNTAMKANIFINIATVLAAVVTSFAAFNREMTEAEMRQRRLNNAILDELDAIIALEEGTSARARAMRAFKGEFAEMLGLIDIELATEDELIELRALAIRQEEEKMELATNESTIKAKEKELVLLKQQIEADKELLDNFDEKLKKAQEADDAAGGGGIIAGVDNQQERLLFAQKNRAENRKNNAILLQIEIDALNDRREAIKESLALQLQDTEIYQRLRLNGEDTFRVKLKELLDKQLNDFRELNQKEQEAVISKKEQELFEKSSLVKYFDMISSRKLLYGEDLTAMNNRIEEFVQEVKKGEDGLKGFDLEARANIITNGENGESIEKLGIEVSLLDNFMNDLIANLKIGTKEFKDFVDVGFKLNKTKDLLKEVNKAIVEATKDRLDQQRVSIETEFQTEEAARLKQLALVESNIEAIQDVRDTGNKEIIKQTIQNNRSKFEVLKNLSIEEQELIKKDTNEANAFRLELLDKMLAEEGQKRRDNQALEVLNLAIKNDKIERLLNEEVRANEKAANDIARARLEEDSKGEFGFFANLKKRIAARNQDAASQIKFLQNEQQRLTAGLAENSATRIRIENETAAQIKKIQSDTNQQNLEDQQAAIQKVGEYYAAAFTAFSTFMSNQLALERQGINERFDSDREDRETALEAELEALGNNEAAKENLRVIAAQREEDLEEKKNQELRKIAKKEFHIQKANDIISAVINGAVAITKVAGQTGIGAIAAAPLMSALVAAQIAAIASQKFVGKKGGMIPEFAKGGMVHGPSHAQGGVKFNAGGRVVELEGGEAVINKRSTAMFRPQLSAMNVAGGGVAFQDGGITPTVAGLANRLQSARVSPDQQMQDFAGQIVSGINNKTVTVTEGAITQTQTNIETIELTSTLFD